MMKFSINKEKAIQLAEELGVKVTFNSEKPGDTIKEIGETFDFKVFFGEFFTEEEMGYNEGNL